MKLKFHKKVSKVLRFWKKKSLSLFLISLCSLCPPVLISCETKIEKPKVEKPTPKPRPANQPRIMLFGDSLTAGFGLENLETESFPALLQARLDAEDYNYEVINAGSNGDKTSDGLGRIERVLKFEKIEIFVLELGANDVVKQIPAAEIKQNLQNIISQVKAKNIKKILLCGYVAPKNLSENYREEIAQMYVELARENEIPLMPNFMLEIEINSDKILDDNVHPNAEGAKILAKHLYRELKPWLKK